MMGKDPDAILDYHVDWSNWLVENDTISTSQWLVDDDLTIIAEAFGNQTTTVWISGGETGRLHGMTNRIATSAGRIDDRTISIFIEER